MFLCILRTDGSAVTPEDIAACTQRMCRLGARVCASIHRGPFGAIVGCGNATPRIRACSSSIVQHGGFIGVGDARLDGCAEVSPTWLRLANHSALARILSLYVDRGADTACELVGDFAFVIWNEATGVLTASRDAFGIRALFYASSPRRVALASHLSLVADESRVDEDFIADFLAGGDIRSDRTIWANARTVPAGCTLGVRGRTTWQREYWSAAAFEPSLEPVGPHHVEAFGAELRRAVAAQLTGGHVTWAELSGGLDSSTIVVLARRLAEDTEGMSNLDGTVTLFDELGLGDERRYSDLLTRRLGLRNEVVANAWAWEDDGEEPPRTDEPRLHYPFFARTRRVLRILGDAGCQVLLSGLGAEFYLLTKRRYLLDWLMQGRALAVARELAKWAVAERRSFWRIGTSEILAPALPAVLRSLVPGVSMRAPAWVEPAFARRLGFAERLPAVRRASLPRGSAFAASVAEDVRVFGGWLLREFYDSGIELRYPFLHRPLAELGLRLPLLARARPGTSKWVLREAMRELLPEEIRTRQGKGGIDSRIAWSIVRERRRLDEILRDPVLAQIGAVNPLTLRAAVADAAQGRVPSLIPLMSALALETWLYVRSGRWSVSENPDRGARVGSSSAPGDSRR